MEFGVHLPLIGFRGRIVSWRELHAYVRAAESLGFSLLSANDHMVFSRPWLDGPTALASVIGNSGRMTLMTSVALPVVRGPVQLAKILTAIDLLSDGRLIAAVGPGSSARDYALVGIPFAERWKRFAESVHVLRAWLRRGAPEYAGQFYSTHGTDLEPVPARKEGVPIWIGSWGSDAGLRRVARLGDGWLSSAYNATPEAFADARTRLRGCLAEAGKPAAEFPNAIASMFCYFTDDRGLAENILRELVTPALNRPEDELGARLLIGSSAECAEKLARYDAVGVQRVLLWPVADEVQQLEIFRNQVMPLLRTPSVQS